jgi:hypothetical protein
MHALGAQAGRILTHSSGNLHATLKAAPHDLVEKTRPEGIEIPAART